MSDANESLMRIALHAARKGTRKVRPNPLVGCAIELRDGEIVDGFHEICGGPHAERVALSKIQKKGLSPLTSRVAVTLEPCSHTGRTPPCVDALIEAKVAQVIIPFCDPNPKVAGSGVKKLEAAGIEVLQGVCTKEAYLLNKEWLWAQKLRRPFVTLKIATSKNAVGVATDRKWITSVAARQHAMLLRARVDVLISSGETLRADNPAFTVRLEDGSLSAEQPHVMLFSRQSQLGESKKILEHPSWEWHQSESLLQSLESLFEKGIFDVMLECGPTLAKDFMQEGLVDEIWHYEYTQNLEGRCYDFSSLDKFSLDEVFVIDSDNIFKRYTRLDRSQVACFAF